MSFLSYIRREYIVRVRWGLAGTISRAYLTNCNTFSFPWVANHLFVSSIESIWAGRHRERKMFGPVLKKRTFCCCAKKSKLQTSSTNVLPLLVKAGPYSSTHCKAHFIVIYFCLCYLCCHLNALHQFALFSESIHIISKSFYLIYHICVSLQKRLKTNEQNHSHTLISHH